MTASIRISHYALNAPTGSHPAGVYWACQAGIPAYQADRNRCIPHPVSGTPDPVMLGRIPAEHDEAPFNPQRLIPAVDALLDENGPALMDSRILLCLPAPDRARYERLQQSLLPWLHNRLAEVCAAGEIRVTCPHTLPEALVEEWQHLQQGNLTALTLLGLDSLLNEETLNERQSTNDIRTHSWSHGRILSEAIALVRFEASHTLQPGDITCTGLGSSAAATDHPHQQGQALATAARQTAANDTVARPDRLVLARAQTRDHELSWHSTQTSLWPVRLSNRDNLAMRKGEKEAPQPTLPAPLHILRPALTIGDSGAATLPIGLITACEALRFRVCPAATALVLDSPGGPQHLAMQLHHQRQDIAQHPGSKEGTRHE
ncbi:MAG: hypothetical protein VX793_00605 [Pseudomonadota bacterium]|nr:hypothetical protein [Pseudomonadota bacterium]